MKVFFITHTFGGLGGSELYVKDLLTVLSSKGIELFVFAPDQGKELGKKPFGVKGYYLTPSWGHHAFHKFEYILFYKDAIRLAKEFGADIVHAHNSCFPGIIGHKIKKKLKIPHITSIEGLTENNRSLHQRVVINFEKYWWPKLNSDVIASWHNYTLEKFLIPWGVPRKKTMVIPGAIDINVFSPDADGSEFTKKFGKHLIGTARSLNGTNSRRIEHIIRAMEFVVKKHPEYKLLIFGGGEGVPAMKKLVKEKNLEKNVFFPGSIASKEVPKMYAACDIAPFVFKYGPVTSSGLMEAMACGKAVVASGNEGLEDYVHENAVIVQDTPEEFAKGIIELIENPAKRKELGKKVRKIAVERFSIEKIADQYIKLYEKLAGKKGKK